jgi:hypothetical protein
MKYLKEFTNNDIPIETSIKYMRIPKEYKDIAVKLVKQYTTAKNGKITGLNLHPDLKKKVEEGGYPSGYDMGIDKNGFYIHTHRARSKSHENPADITAEEMKQTDSTG